MPLDPGQHGKHRERGNQDADACSHERPLHARHLGKRRRQEQWHHARHREPNRHDRTHAPHRLDGRVGLHQRALQRVERPERNTHERLADKRHDDEGIPT